MIYDFQNRTQFSKKIKEEFFVKGKIFFIDYYFTSLQTPKNMKKWLERG
jgi:hypothetical protein